MIVTNSLGLHEWHLEILDRQMGEWVFSAHNVEDDFTFEEAMREAIWLSRSIKAHYRIVNIRTGAILPAAIL